jgi:hypothetical protein
VKKYLVIVVLMAYAPAELSRYIVACGRAGILTWGTATIELSLMWAAFLTGAYLMAGRLQKAK